MLTHVMNPVLTPLLKKAMDETGKLDYLTGDAANDILTGDNDERLTV